MNILHIDTEKNWRGGQNQLLLLIRGLKKLGIKNHCIFQPGATFLERFENEAQFVLISMRNEMDVKAARKIADYCDKNQIEIVHAHTARAHSLALWVKFFRKNLKLVVHKRVEPKTKLAFFDRLKYKSALVDQYIVISSYIQTRFLALGISKDKITLIPSGVEISSSPISKEDAKKQFFEKFNLPTSEILFGSASHLSKLKGQEFFLRALAKVKDHIEWQAVIAGEGELRDELEILAQQLKISERVHFVGFLREVDELFRASDVFVLPSLWEGLGSSLLNAAVSGCCLVATNVGGVSDIVINQTTGLLVEPRNEEALGRALSTLLDRVTLIKSLANKAEEHVRKNFNVESMIHKTHEVYLRIQ